MLQRRDFLKYIDLHIHSKASDGTQTPKEVVELAYHSQLSAIALTDHDTIDGVIEAEKMVEQLSKEGKDLRLIPGIEISVEYQGKDIHILGLFIDIENKNFKKELVKIRERRNKRNELMLRKFMDDGIDITMDILNMEKNDLVLTRSHFAKFLIARGYAKDREDAFKRFLRSNTPYYVEREHLTTEEGIRIIHEAGGLAILAHPLLYGYQAEELEAMVTDFSKIGLDGIEAIYSMNRGEDEINMLKLAEKYNLAVSGGSDFHGKNKPHIQMGVGLGSLKIPYELLEKLENRRIQQ